MKTKTKLITAITCLITICSSTAQDISKSYILKYDLSNNKNIHVDNRSNITDNKIESGKENPWIYTTTNMLLDYEMISLTSDNKMLLEMEYKDKNFTNYWADERIDKRDYSNIKGGRIRFKMSEYGEISDFEGFDKLNLKLANGNDINPEGLQEEIIHLFPHLPDQPVKIGGKWTGGVDAEGAGESFTLEYVLLGEEKVNGIDCLKFTAHYTTESDFPYESQRGPLQVKTKSKGHDIYYFAYKKGFLLSRISIGNGTVDIYDAQDGLIQSRKNEVLYNTIVKF